MGVGQTEAGTDLLNRYRFPKDRECYDENDQRIRAVSAHLRYDDAVQHMVITKWAADCGYEGASSATHGSLICKRPRHRKITGDGLLKGQAAANGIRSRNFRRIYKANCCGGNPAHDIVFDGFAAPLRPRRPQKHAAGLAVDQVKMAPQCLKNMGSTR
jgi:hypothetical protein